MSEAAQHPSYFDLDCFALGAEIESIRAHVRSCSKCQAYLARLGPVCAMPGWARALRDTRAGWFTRREQRGAWSWFATAAWAGAVAAGVLAVVWSLPEHARPVATLPSPLRSPTREKGSPAVALFIKRGEEVFAWRESEPLAAMDQVRLQVAPAGAKFITVLDCIASGPRVLHAGPLPPSETSLLPIAWQLDASAEPERLMVIFGYEGLAPAQGENEKACKGELPSGTQAVQVTLRKRRVGEHEGEKDE